MAIITFLLALILVLSISFCIISGTVWIICWCLGVAFTWKIALAIYLIWLIVGGKFSISINNKNKSL